MAQICGGPPSGRTAETKDKLGNVRAVGGNAHTNAKIGAAGLAANRHLDPSPGALVGDEGFECLEVQLVTPAIGAVAAEDGRASEGEVADGVQHLVPHEFIAEAQAFRVDDAVVANDHGVLKRRAEGKAPRP